MYQKVDYKLCLYCQLWLQGLPLSTVGYGFADHKNEIVCHHRERQWGLIIAAAILPKYVRHGKRRGPRDSDPHLGCRRNGRAACPPVSLRRHAPAVKIEFRQPTVHTRLVRTSKTSTYLGSKGREISY